MAKKFLFLDFETKSDADLKSGGVYQYSTGAEFDTIVTAYAFDNGPVTVTDGWPVDEAFNNALIDSDIIKVAHNSAFDRVAASRKVFKDPAKFLDASQWQCSMVIALSLGYRAALNDLAGQLKLGEKTPEGKDLIRKFSLPDEDGKFSTKTDYPEDWELFRKYAEQDVNLMRRAYWTLVDQLTEAELDDVTSGFAVDQWVNDYGVPVDLELAKAAEALGMWLKGKALRDLKTLTRLENPNSQAQLLRWMQGQGYKGIDIRADNMRRLVSATVPEKFADLQEAARLRLAASSTSVTKFTALRNRTSPDSRLRGAFAYFGSHTGRWAGRGVQMQNLPKSLPEGVSADSADVDEVLEAEARRAKEDPGSFQSMAELKPLIRGTFKGNPGFCVADFNAVEPRTLAWLSGEDWVLDAFEDGRDIYVETAARMGSQFTRQHGKVAVLALGYGGGVRALDAMSGGMKFPGDKMEVVAKFRKANPNTARFWRDLENAFINTGQAGRITVESPQRGVRKVILPSGRSLYYRGVRMVGDQVVFSDRFGTQRKVWKGLLAENVTQAVARDLLMHSMRSLVNANYALTGHVHDEVIIEAPKERLDDIISLMSSTPEWAEGLPIRAEGYYAPRYRKG